MKHLTMAELEAGLEHIRQAPEDNGVLEMIVRRPQVDERQVLEEGRLDLLEGLVGDDWSRLKSESSEDGLPNCDMQINVMNARAIALIAQDKTRWPLAGDQLYIDMDLSVENMPVGTRLAVGSSVIEVTAQPHNACKKFAARFGLDAMKFLNSAVGKQLHLRGINAKVVQGGAIRVGEVIKKM